MKFYTVDKEINGKLYTCRFGNRQLINLEDQDINIMEISKNFKISTLMKIGIEVIPVCKEDIGKKGKEKLTLDEFIEWFDNSDMSNEDLSKLVEECIDKGIMKGKKLETAQEETKKFLEKKT